SAGTNASGRTRKERTVVLKDEVAVHCWLWANPVGSIRRSDADTRLRSSAIRQTDRASLEMPRSYHSSAVILHAVHECVSHEPCQTIREILIQRFQLTP